MSDDVNHPSHYTVGGIEAIDVIRAKLTPEEFRGYCKGSILHYLMRSNWKDEHDQDCKKAQWYSNELVRTLPRVVTPEMALETIPEPSDSVLIDGFDTSD